MRYEVIANKTDNRSDIEYFKTYNEIEATIKAWELRMSGYNTKIVINENKED